jgi:DNA invertase Pin-like site-specific DNA recombinase
MEATFHDGVTITVHDVIVLARNSQKVKGRVATSIESQDEDARDWAENMGLNVVATVPDIASGKKAMWQRPNAKSWVTQSELMIKYQAIVASKHDRLSRADWQDENELRDWSEKNHIALFLVEKDLRWPPRPGAQYNDDVDNWNRAAGDSNREWNNTSRRWKRGHKQRASNNQLSGKAPFGYRITGINCGQSPCRCFENGEDDPKTLTIYEPEAKIVRDVVTRYLAGESTEQICKDYPRWVPSSLARFLRNPAIVGRRTNSEGKAVLRYDGIITWEDHLALIKRLDSRARRKGISPANSYMLTGIISCDAGHAMYGNKGGGKWYHYACRYCGFGARVDLADPIVAKAVLSGYGDEPCMIKRVIPGKNHFEEIARLRQDRDEVQAEMDKAMDRGDDPAPYQARYMEINAGIRTLTNLDNEHPQPDRIGWVKNGKTIAEHWQSLDTAGRRDWLRENGWKVTAVKDDEMSDGWRLIIDAGWTAQVGGERQIASLGYPVSEEAQWWIDLPKHLGIDMPDSDAETPPSAQWRCFRV